MERSQKDWEKLMKKSNIYSNSIVHGIETAKNMTVLQYNDIKRNVKKDGFLNNASNRTGIKREKLEEYDILDNKGLKNIEETVDLYRNLELKNRKEYEEFYNGIEENDFYKVSANLLYGATSTLLNPIEFTKNMAINTTVGAMTGGAGLVVGFGANMLADTVDNFYSNTWEDELLGLKRETSENIVQSIGGALISNAIFPVAKFTGKKILGLSGENIVVKGNTVREDILEPAVAKQYRKELEEVTAVDMSHRDFRIGDSVKKDYIKAQATEEDTVRVFPKQEMKNNIIEERTGVIPGIVDYKNMTDKILEMSDIFGKELKEKQAKLQKGTKGIITLGKVEQKFNSFLKTKNAMDTIYNSFVAPMIVSQDSYNIANLKTMRKMHPKFSDTMSLSLKGQGYNELLGEMIEDKSVAKEMINFRKSNISSGYALKETENWNIDELIKFTNDKNRNFYRAIENAVTYNVKENESLMLTNPRYQKYFSNTENLFQFEDEIIDIFGDFKNNKIRYEEIAPLLEAKRTRYENLMLNIHNDSLEYGDFIKSVKHNLDKKNFDFDKLIAEIEETKNLKIESAAAKLSIDKEKLLTILATKDSNELKTMFGDKIYNLKHINDGGEFDDEFVETLFHSLNETTRDVNTIKEELKNFASDENPLEKYDLNNFINKFFEGKTKKEKVDNFINFSEDFLRDNWDMLNVMDKITRNDQASMSSLGVPFKVIEDIVDNNGSFTEILRNIPQMRKYIIDDPAVIERLKNSDGYQRLSEELMYRLRTFIENEKVFKKSDDKEIINEVLNSGVAITRNILLTASGIGEFLQHPFLAGIKAVKTGGNILTGLVVAPVSVVSTLYKSIEPFVAKSVGAYKLYNGLASLIQTKNIDMAEELALMELAVNSKMLFGQGDLGWFRRAGKTASDFAMYVQNVMQKNRYMASRLVGISTIKKYLRANKFDELKPSAKKLLSTLGIKDTESLKQWQAEVEAVGLKKALYVDGANEKTKLLHGILTRNSYEEDAMSLMREQTKLNDITAKIKMMFTSYDRSLFNYVLDALKYAENDNGIYISRFSKGAMKYNVKDGAYGIAAFGMLGTAGLVRQYMQSKAYGDSKDEMIEARIKSSYLGNRDSQKKLAYDFLENALPISYLYQTGVGFKGSPIAILRKRFVDRVSEGHYIGAVIPPKLELLYNKYYGTQKYKKYSGMNRQEKYLYKRLVLQDKMKENKIKDFLQYAFSDVMVEKLKEEKLITAVDALELRRQNGYNDKEIVEKLKGRGLETVKQYAIVNSASPEEVKKNLEMGIEKIANKKMTESEIIEAMDNENEFPIDNSEIVELIEKFGFTKEEYKQEEYKYYKQLVEAGYDELEIIERLTLYAFELYNK